MTPRPEGDCFYECLQAEIRGVIPMSEAIRTKADFEVWRHVTIGDDSMALQQSLSQVEALFGKQLTIVVSDNRRVSRLTLSVEPKTSIKVKSRHIVLRFQLRDGVFSSPRYAFDETSAVHGLDSVEFWLKNISVHISKAGNTSSAALFVVGTHLDQATGNADIRRERVMDIVQRVGLTLPVFVHEISMFSMAGTNELQPGVGKLYDEITRYSYGMPHMGETVPHVYLEVLKAVQKLSRERKRLGQSWSISSCMFHKLIKIACFSSNCFFY